MSESGIAPSAVCWHARSNRVKKLVDLFEAIDLFEVKREKSASHTGPAVRIAKVRTPDLDQLWAVFT